MVHANYVQMVAHRMQANAGEKTVKTIDAGKFGKLGGGYYDLRNGHTLLWTNIPNPQDRPLYVAHEELAARLGKLKAEWAMDRSRNLLIYPNLLLMDQASSQIRVFRPLAVNRTEVTAYCFAPVANRPPNATSASASTRTSSTPRHGHARRPQRVQRDAEGLRRLRTTALERHLAWRGARDTRARRRRQRARYPAGQQRSGRRRRRHLRRPARTLAAADAGRHGGILMNDFELTRSVHDFLYREGEYLDQQRWDEWLALFDPEAEYWIPAWDGEHELTADPMREMSLMYYRNRSGLEDRIFRLRTGRSSASVPLPRTTHLVSNIRIGGFDGSQCQVTASWVVFSFKDKQSHQFNGRYEYVLAAQGGDWVIKRKKIIVNNEVIPSLMDIYSI